MKLEFDSFMQALYCNTIACVIMHDAGNHHADVARHLQSSSKESHDCIRRTRCLEYLRCLPREPSLSSLRFSFKSRTNTSRRVNLTSRFSCAESLRDSSESSFENLVFLDRRDERIVLEDFRRSPPCNVRAKRQSVPEQPTCYAHFEQPGSSLQSSVISPPSASANRH